MSNFPDIIQVGQPIERDHEGEGCRLTWRENYCELLMGFSHLKTAEIEGVEQGLFEFGLTVVEQMPFVCFRVFQTSPARGFGKPTPGKLAWPWQECPFHLSRFNPQDLPHFDAFRSSATARLSLAVILAERPTLKVRALRFFTLSPTFTQKLIITLLETLPAYTRESYERAVQTIYRTHATGSLGERSRVRCHAGD